MFGASNTFGGGNSTFGSNNNNTGFGNTGGGGFGTNNNAGNTGLFGSSNNTGGFGASSGGGFGTTATTGGFGATNTTGGFGATGGAFGSTNTGGFGSSTSTMNNTGFGSTSTSTGFSSSNTTGGFGNSTGFGSSTTNTGFGNTTTPATGGFGGFGSSTPNTGGFGGGGFNSNAGTTGTGNPPWQITRGDPSKGDNTNEKYMAITMMPQYASKSFEELRLEDYAKGFKPGGGGSAPAAPLSSPGAFGAPSTNTFGGSTNAFGAATNTPTTGAFGSNTGGAFGSTNTSSGGLFGSQPNSSPSAFGSTTGNTGGLFGGNNTNTNTGGLFGGNTANTTNNTGGGLFGNNNPSSGGGGLFGNSSTSAFGANTNSTPGAFGSTASNTGGGLFGSQPNSSPSMFGSANNTGGGGLFGNNTAANTNTGGSLFGNTNTNTSGGGLFGGNNNSNTGGGGLFGNSTNNNNTGSLFGNNNNSNTGTSGGLFGSTTNTGASSGGLFGNSNNNTSGGSLFGNNNSMKNTGSAFGAPASGSLFGNTNSGGSSLFGNSNTNNNSGGGGLFGNSNSTSTFGSTMNQSNGLFGNNNNVNQNNQQQAFGGAAQPVQLSMVAAPAPYATGNVSQMARHVMLAQEAWKPVPNQEPKARDNTKSSSTSTIAKSAIRASSSRDSLGASVRPKSRGFGRGYGSLVAMNNVSSDALVLRSASKNSGRPSTSQSQQDVAQMLSPGVFDLNKRLSIRKTGRKQVVQSPAIEIADKPDQGRDDDLRKNEQESSTKKQLFVGKSGNGPSPIPMKNLDDTDEEPSARRPGPRKTLSRSSSDVNEDGFVVVKSPVSRRDWSHETAPDSGDSTEPLSDRCPVMSDDYYKAGYEINPPMKTLKEMTDDELSKVRDFSVKRAGHGAVKWFGAVDVRDLIIHEVIEIEDQSIEVYKDGKGTPERGTGLNRPALCTVEKVDLPPDFEEDPDKFIALLEELNTKQDANFVDYDSTTGTWTFQVKHFTKYGFIPQSNNSSKKNSSTNSAGVAENGSVERVRPTSPLETQVRGMATSQEPNFDNSKLSPSIQSRDVSSSNLHASPVPSRTTSARSPWSGSRLPRFIPPSRPMVQQQQQPETTTGESTPMITDQNVEARSLLPVKKDESIYVHAALQQSTAQRLFQEAVEEEAAKTNQSVKRFHRPMCLNRSFRVSWGPNGELVHCGNPVSPNTSNPVLYRNVVVERVNTAVNPGQLENQLVQHVYARKEREMMKIESLEDDVSESALIQVGDEDHWTKLLHNYIASGFDQLKNATNTERKRLQHQVRVWSLLNAIWGQTILTHGPVPSMADLKEASRDMANLMEASMESETDEKDNGHVNCEPFFTIVLPKQQAQTVQDHLTEAALESVNIWLRRVIREMDDVSPPRSQSIAHAHPGWDVSAGRIEKACEKAIEQGNFRLATLLSQAAGDTKVRQLLQSQLSIWEESGSISHIDSDIFDAYQTISGMVGPRQQSETSWIRSFALHLWHKCPPLSPLYRSVESFRTSLAQHDNNVRPRAYPIPWYLGTGDISDLHVSPEEDMTCWDTGLDMLFHVLCLASDRDTYPLRRVLEPAGHTSDVLDYSFSWHVGQLLKGLQLAGLLSQDLDDVRSQSLHMNFAFQLETLGMWHWAVYVVHQLPPPLCDRAVSEILHRHCTPTTVLGQSDRDSGTLEDKLEFLRTVVGVPESLIAAAKRCRAHYEFDYESEFANAVTAREWETFHELLVTRLGPANVMDGQTPIILDVLESARQVGLVTDLLPNWKLGGGLFEHYAHLKMLQTELSQGGEESLILEFVTQLAAFGTLLLQHQDLHKSGKQLNLLQRQSFEEMGAWLHTAWLGVRELVPVDIDSQVLDLPRVPSRFDVHKRMLSQLVSDYASSMLQVEHETMVN